MRETQAPYRLTLSLSAPSATRVRIDALLDLTDFQSRLPELLIGEPILDVCGNRTDVAEIDVTVEGRRINILGEVRTQFHACERGAERDRLVLRVDAEGSALLRNNCVYFEIIDIDVGPAKPVFEPDARERLNAVRTLLAEAIRLVLAETLFCPDLPADLAMLDPRLESGSPREIGAGVQGVGSVDVSTGTILEVLRVLQREGLMSGPP